MFWLSSVLEDIRNYVLTFSVHNNKKDCGVESFMLLCKSITNTKNNTFATTNYKKQVWAEKSWEKYVENIDILKIDFCKMKTNLIKESQKVNYCFFFFRTSYISREFQTRQMHGMAYTVFTKYYPQMQMVIITIWEFWMN